MESANANNQAIDWAWVQRTVAATEPPRLVDVPAHIKFLKIWGGGADQHFILQTLDYIEQNMQPGRIVNGQFLEKLASVKCSVSDMMPRIVHACLMVQATGHKERESVGLTISDAHVKSIQTSKKTICQKCEEMLLKTHAVLRKCDGDMQIYGDMACAFVKHIFEIPSDIGFPNLDAIAHHFVKQICGTESDELEAVVPSAGRGETMSDCVTFGDGGASDAGRMTLRNSGFFVGAVLEFKNKEGNTASSGDEQWEMVYVNDDGSAGLSKIDVDGATKTEHVVKESLDNILTLYKVAKARIELVEEYPKNAAKNSEDMSMLKARATVAFAFASLQHDNEENFADIDFRCQRKPIQRVFVMECQPVSCVPVSHLRVIPLTPKILKPTKAPSASSPNLEVRVGTTVLHLGRCVDKTCVSEFWLMRTVSDADKANMIIKNFKVAVNVHDAERIVVTMPCAVNTRKVKKGDELVLYRPAVAGASSSKDVSAMFAPSSKKQRV